jgi:hypothetical protein
MHMNFAQRELMSSYFLQPRSVTKHAPRYVARGIVQTRSCLLLRSNFCLVGRGRVLRDPSTILQGPPFIALRCSRAPRRGTELGARAQASAQATH